MGRDKHKIRKHEEELRKRKWEEKEHYPVEEQQAEQGSAQGYCVLVRGLPSDVNENDVKRALAPNGAINDVKFVQGSEGVVQLAVVHFSDKSGAQRACHMSESVQLKGVALRISAPKGGIAPTVSAKTILHKQARRWVGVTVDRIPKGCSDTDVRAAAKVHGAVAQVELKREGKTAHIDYVTLLGAQTAVEKGLSLKGTNLAARLRQEVAEDASAPLITLHLAGLNPKTTVEHVKTALAECGHIRDVRLAGENGFVDVETKTAAKKASKLSPVNILGRDVTISLSKKQIHLTSAANAAAAASNSNASGSSRVVDEKHRSNKTIFVKNLAYDMDDFAVRKIFQLCGRVTDVRLFKNPETQEFKGMAFVDLENAEQVEKAVALNGKDVKGRKIVVDYTIGKKEALEALGKTLTENVKKNGEKHHSRKRQRS